MSDTVKTLMKRSVSTARKYRSLDRQLIQLIEQYHRAGSDHLLRKQIEAKKAVIVAEMVELSGGL